MTETETPVDHLHDPDVSARLIQTSYPNGHFYSPVVDPADLNTRLDEIYPATPEAPGIDFQDDQHRHLIEHALKVHLPDYDYPEHGDPDHALKQFYTQNSQFSWLDSRALFALLRHWKPRRVLEVGSGYSSALMSDVNRRFLDGAMQITCIEPFPRPFLKDPEFGVALEVCRVQQLPIARFEALEAGDLLFIDSSHVAKTGSDVNYLFLQILPRLKPGVIVHVHDIFLPFEYPREWTIGENRSWNEQYLLQALLQFSTGYRVLFGCNYAFYRFPAEVIAAIAHPKGHGFGGGSFYFQRV